MIECLELDNVGPAPRMKVEFAPRVNLITGDNGLGKSFLLDTAWWAFAADWPAEVNRGMTTGLVARPRDRSRASTIRFRTRSDDGTIDSEGTYSRRDEAWMDRSPSTMTRCLAVYAHADGSFSVWDVGIRLAGDSPINTGRKWT